jgi:hypothetical protein
VGSYAKYLIAWHYPHTIEKTAFYGGSASYSIKSKPITGWLCPEKWGSAIEHAVDYINQSVPPGDSLLVMPPWQIVYALTNRDSYKKAPFTVVPKSIPAPGKQFDILVNQIRSDPPDWIVTHVIPETFPRVINLYTAYLRLDSFLLREYLLERQWENLVILRKKNQK